MRRFPYLAAAARRLRPLAAAVSTSLLVTLVTGAVLGGCQTRPATQTSAVAAPSAAVRETLAPGGTLRVAVYRGSPSSYLPPDAMAQPRGVAYDLGRAMAASLGVRFELVLFERNDDALRATREGKADFIFTNASPERQKTFDFSPAVMDVEKSVLVPAGSRFTSLETLRGSAARIGISVGSSTGRELPLLFPQLIVVETASLQQAAEMLAQGQLDGFATNKAILYEMSDRLPGSTVLPGTTGAEHFAIGIPQGREAGLAWMRSFAREVKANGTLREAIQRAGLRGVRAAD